MSVTETYKIVKDAEDRDAIEITATHIQKKVIDKQSIIDEIARLQTLLDKFP